MTISLYTNIFIKKKLIPNQLIPTYERGYIPHYLLDHVINK